MPAPETTPSTMDLATISDSLLKLAVVLTCIYGFYELYPDSAISLGSLPYVAPYLVWTISIVLAALSTSPLNWGLVSYTSLICSGAFTIVCLSFVVSEIPLSLTSPPCIALGTSSLISLIAALAEEHPEEEGTEEDVKEDAKTR